MALDPSPVCIDCCDSSTVMLTQEARVLGRRVSWVVCAKCGDKRGEAMKLRGYQERAIGELRAAYHSGRRAPCLVLPTGAGKTVVAAEIIRSAVSRGNRVLFLAHRTELITQSVGKLEVAGVSDVRIIQASSDLGSPVAPVTVASIPTLTRWKDRLPQANVVVFDECHHVVAKTWKTLADRYASAHLLGMTATPQRSDGSPLGDVFDALVVGATVAELTELGHLVPCRVWSPPEVLDAGKLAVSPLTAYQQHAEGQRAVVFCGTVERAEAIAAEMTAAGVPTATIHGNLPAKTRAERLAALLAGDLRCVANVHVLTEGWDMPEVEVCILERKPQHAGTYLQMVGRVLRPAAGKTSAKLLDLCGSSLEHGPPELARKYTLDGKGISKTERDAIRQCPHCGGVFLARAATDGTCPQCGMALPVRPMKQPTVTGIGLVEGKAAVDQLLINLRAVAKRTRRGDGWAERAAAAIRRSA